MEATMVNSSLKFGFYKDEDSKLYEYSSNSSRDNPQKLTEHPVLLIVVFTIYSLTFLICILGIVGNGKVIWLLGFRMKMNPFTIFILNLAIADIGLLLVSISECMYAFLIVLLLCHKAVSLLAREILPWLRSFLCITDMLLLTAISIDRCVAVRFPVWHRCHRQPGLSKVVCVFIWVLSLLLTGLDILFVFEYKFILLQFILNVAICTPLMAVSTVFLFSKICTKSQQCKRGKLLVTILLALFSFLIFGFPVNCWLILMQYYESDYFDIRLLVNASYTVSSRTDLIYFSTVAAFGCMVLNGSVNPLIYFLMGRDKSRSMKTALQRIFKDEESSKGQSSSISDCHVGFMHDSGDTSLEMSHAQSCTMNCVV